MPLFIEDTLMAKIEQISFTGLVDEEEDVASMNDERFKVKVKYLRQQRVLLLHVGFYGTPKP